MHSYCEDLEEHAPDLWAMACAPPAPAPAPPENTTVAANSDAAGEASTPSEPASQGAAQDVFGHYADGASADDASAMSVSDPVEVGGQSAAVDPDLCTGDRLELVADTPLGRAALGMRRRIAAMERDQRANQARLAKLQLAEKVRLAQAHGQYGPWSSGQPSVGEELVDSAKYGSPVPLVRSIVHGVEATVEKGYVRQREAIEAGRYGPDTAFIPAAVAIEDYLIDPTLQSLDDIRGGIRQAIAADDAYEAALGVLRASLGGLQVGLTVSGAVGLGEGLASGLGPGARVAGEAAAAGGERAVIEGAERRAAGGVADDAMEAEARGTPQHYEPMQPAKPRASMERRPTPRESEVTVSEELGDEFSEQRSFKEGEDVPHGTRESTRPDNYSAGNKISVEVKNYEVVTDDGRKRLVHRLSRQIKERCAHLPKGTRQAVVIDVRGQLVDAVEMDTLRDRIVGATDGLVQPDDIVFLSD